MENKIKDFGKAIYLGADPVVAIIENIQTFDHSEIDGWIQNDGRMEIDFDSTLRSEHLDLSILKSIFPSPPSTCRLVKLMPQSKMEIEEEVPVGILCMKEYPAGGLVEIANLDKVWSQKGLLICSSPSKIILHGAITESIYLIFTF